MTLSHNIEKQELGLHSKTPYIAHIKSRHILNTPSSTKKTLHVVLDLGDTGITYQVGSCFGIFPQNDPACVKEFLEIFANHASSPIIHKKSGEALSVKAFLLNYANLNSLNSNFLKLVNHPSLGSKEFVETHDPLLFLKENYTQEIPIQSWCDCFQPLLPRYYSIASSQKHVGNEVHLMVATFAYEHAGQKKQGVTSSYLLSEETTHVPIFLQNNPRFTLPENNATPIIMVGPGTGVAPFIGFIQERQKVPSKNWLFFGERNKKEDFYYEEFLTKAVSQGSLKLVVAFSRDQQEKLYVQHKSLEQSKELWKWIDQEGASLYICGDAKKMAKDVTGALLTISGRRVRLRRLPIMED
jgi:sulfite reductase (NADPH) flavoprotein alpha-component